MMPLQRRRLGLGAGEGLDDRHVAERVGGLLGEARMEALDGALQGLGLAHDDRGQDREHEHEEHEEEAEAPVQEHGERQEDEERDQRGEVVAEEAEPEPGHAVRAFEHDLEDASRMRRGVERERQLEHMLEIVRHGGEPAPVREAVGVQRHGDAGPDREQPEPDPGADQRRQRPEGHRRPARGLALRQAVDDAPEQDRLGKGRDRQRDVGERQDGADPQVGAELAEHADVEADQAHRGPPTAKPGTMASPRRDGKGQHPFIGRDGSARAARIGIGSSTKKPRLRSKEGLSGRALLQRGIAAAAGRREHKVNPSFSAPPLGSGDRARTRAAGCRRGMPGGFSWISPPGSAFLSASRSS